MKMSSLNMTQEDKRLRKAVLNQGVGVSFQNRKYSGYTIIDTIINPSSKHPNKKV